MQLDTVFHDAGNGELDALEVVHRICGEAAAIRLRDAFDGERVHFPCRPSADHPISQAIGHENAILAGREIGGIALYVGHRPAYRRWNIIRWASFAGLPKRTIARLTEYRETHIYFVIAKLRGAGLLPARGEL